VFGAEKDAKLRVGCIGVGGMGNKDLTEVAKSPRVEIVALCDVDQHNLIEAWKKFPDAKPYEDWRELLERKDIDAVTVSTPDHTHAPATMTALRGGKHVYCQKPLTHSIYETRQIQLAAKESGLVTQMGIQLHSMSGYQNLVDWIRGDVIGKIIEVHAWSDRPGTIWSQGPQVRRPERSDPVPNCLSWDVWLGVAPERPFVDAVYLPAKWRGWLDFGTGAQGDMGCHIIDPVVWALDLVAPTKLLSRGPKPNGHTYPVWSTVEYTFPGNARTASKTMKMTWYDGGKKPSNAIAPLPPGRELPSNGQLFVGERGVLLCEHGQEPELLPGEKFSRVTSPGRKARSHWAEWSSACLQTGKTSASFDYAGPLTEIVLLGNVALHFPDQELQWESESLRFTDVAGASALVRRPYRDGWQIPGLS
jgi:predicted dehydrogenase